MEVIICWKVLKLMLLSEFLAATLLNVCYWVTLSRSVGLLLFTMWLLTSLTEPLNLKETSVLIWD